MHWVEESIPSIKSATIFLNYLTLPYDGKEYAPTALSLDDESLIFEVESPDLYLELEIVELEIVDDDCAFLPASSGKWIVREVEDI